MPLGGQVMAPHPRLLGQAHREATARTPKRTKQLQELADAPCNAKPGAQPLLPSGDLPPQRPPPRARSHAESHAAGRRKEREDRETQQRKAHAPGRRRGAHPRPWRRWSGRGGGPPAARGAAARTRAASAATTSSRARRINRRRAPKQQQQQIPAGSTTATDSASGTLAVAPPHTHSTSVCH